MAPTHATRLNSLEKDLVALQSEVLELKETVEEKFNEMKRYFEESLSRATTKQNKRLDECTKGQKELTAAINLLMTEVKKLNAKSNTHNEESQQNHSTSNHERFEVEQSR